MFVYLFIALRHCAHIVFKLSVRNYYANSDWCQGHY